MTNMAVTLEGVGKRYRLGATAQPYYTLRDSLAHAVTAPITLSRRLLSRGSVAAEMGRRPEFWALRDVSFDVQHGEVLGIIGRNGAGKSTLLKVLSQITEPTEGRIKVWGRVASLLEVGTGFHPELTGRENIFLNGAILGMSRQEIASKFDEIVSFAEVEQFVDTQVKRYSSGMYLRLAFAVAAHLEPEILVVDEVLAVGDAAFQKKCLGKMSQVSHSGRTVLFVSHNMDAIRRMCVSVVWLDKGRVKAYGESSEFVSKYLLQEVNTTSRVVFDPPHQMPNGMPARIRSVEISDGGPSTTPHFSARSPLRVSIEWENYARIYKPRIGFVIQTEDGVDVMTALDASSWNLGWLPVGRRRSNCEIPGGLLNEGEYTVDLAGDSPNGFDFKRGRTGSLLRFEVEDDMTMPNKYYLQEGFRDARWPGVLLLNIPWTQDAVLADSPISKEE